MNGVLEAIAEKLIRREEERKRLGEELRSEISSLIHRVEENPVSTTLGAVDGGIVHEEYGPIILLLIRSVGAIFHYEDGELKEVTYVPSPLPDVEIVANDEPIEREDYHPFRSLHRLRSELNRAIQLSELKPEYLFLDGSIVPQIVDKPHSDHLKPLYKSVVFLYRHLYSLYPDVKVVGIVKDSRGNRLGIYLQKEGIDVPNWQDVSWLNYVLLPGEYTAPIPYSDDPSKHATLKDLNDLAENIYITYLRASPFDRPYRIEFYSTSPEKDAKHLVSLLYPLSSLNPHYSIPPFLVEVDLRARLSKESLSYVKSYLERMIVAKFPSFRLYDRRPL